MLELPKEKMQEVSIGKVLLTKLGKELVTVCTAPRVDGFVDYVKEQWKDLLPKPKVSEPGGTDNTGAAPLHV